MVLIALTVKGLAHLQDQLVPIYLDPFMIIIIFDYGSIPEPFDGRFRWRGIAEESNATSISTRKLRFGFFDKVQSVSTSSGATDQNCRTGRVKEQCEEKWTTWAVHGDERMARRSVSLAHTDIGGRGAKDADKEPVTEDE